MGADAVLLIAAALDDDELARFHALATEVGLDVLVEVHDEPELARALGVGATLVGVNQRDLVTFAVDHERAAAIATAGGGRDFRAALADPAGVSVIAEIKRRSPSRGDLFPGLDAAALAKSYAAGGAACLSVLTDVDFFGGSVADLETARAAVDIPVLRKDFTVSERDVYDARIMGADAVLLIAAALATSELARFRDLAVSIGLTALVEVHDEAELSRAIAAGADVIGVNQRDLRSFDVDRELAARLAAKMPDGVVKVAESGIRDAGDVTRLSDAGYDAILVGESLVTSSNPTDAVRSLTLQPRR
jgi:indole-3-glycerol phosphate synthase